MSNAPENYNISKYICNNIISNNVYSNCDSSQSNNEADNAIITYLIRV